MVRIFSNTVLILLGLSCNFLYAQRSVEIFADVKGNDSLQKLVTIFTEQLKKSLPENITVQPASLYKGKGIYINSTSAGNQLVKPTSKLLQSGVEAFSVDANEQTVQILGNCNMAAGHGIFAYLESIGYRFYFANPDWHIIPARPVLFRKWSIVSAPAFHHRRIWYGYGTGSKIADADYNFWILANKLGGSTNASFGHAYEDIAFRNLEVFAKHPDWLYPPVPKGEKPYGAKFDMSKEDLVQFTIQDVEKRIETSLKNRTDAYKMISLAPSDGIGTCNTPACQQLGTITDRVYYLTNRVAKAIQKKYPLTLIGCMAYGEYAPPPTKKVEPNVFVAITTAFNSSKYTIEQLIEEWRKKGAIIGIYDYFSWYAWDFDVPGQSLASRSGEMINNIKKYYAKGVRAYEGESSIGWVSKGLGYYLAAKQMWNVKADPANSKKEFFRLCFGKASSIMEKLWNEWENYSYATVREGDLARWIDYTTEAEKTERDVKVKKRLFQVKSYLHWIFLYRNYQLANTEANLTALLNYGYRKLDDGSVSGFPAFFQLGNNSKFEGMRFDDKAKWKSNNSPVTQQEIDQKTKADRSKLKISEPVKEFLPAAKFYNVPNLHRYSKLTADSAASASNNYWFTNEWVIEIKSKGANNYIDFTGDYLANPTVTKPIKVSVYPYTADGKISRQPVVFYYEYKATQVKEKISLAKLSPGYYTLIIEDPVKIFKLSFSHSMNFSMVMRPERQINSNAFFYAFIYVPDGTKKFNVIKNSLFGLITPTGRKIDFTEGAEDVQVEVQKNEAGLWRVKPIYGKLMVEGIPPYLGISASQMLIPVNAK